MKNLSVKAGVKAAGARVGIGIQKTVSVEVEVGVLLSSVVALGIPLASLFLLASRELYRELQQVCEPAILIGWLSFKDK